MSLKKTRLEEQRETIAFMIGLYCRKNHNNKGLICGDCEELKNYSEKRIEHCRYGNKKPNCGKCSTHCYKRDMREKVKAIMRFSGPRIIFYRPHLALKHIIDQFIY